MAAVYCASERGWNRVGLVPSSRHIVGSLIASLALLTACSGDPSTRADARAAPGSEAVPVSVATVVTKSVPVQVLANGTVQAMATVTINSQVDGQIAAIHFTEGQDVKQGDLWIVSFFREKLTIVGDDRIFPFHRNNAK